MAANIKKKYEFRGLDTKSNKLYRKEGTASDCRNVFLNSNKDLIKRPDFSALSIPRAAIGDRAFNEPTGDFADKLPPLAEIIDIMKYEDHLIVAIRSLPTEFDTFKFNKYYKFFESTGVLELIPLQSFTNYDLDIGTVSNFQENNIDGKFAKVTQEGILYFMGSYPSDGTPQLAEPTKTYQENNLSPLFAYDGDVITFAGTPNGIPDTVTETAGTLTSDEYVRLLPFKIDMQKRTTLGNYSTHRAIHDGLANAKQVLTIPATTSSQTIQRLSDPHQCHAIYTGPTATVVAGATIAINPYRDQPSTASRSLAIGQYVYYINQTTGNPSANVYEDRFELYRMRITDVTVTSATVGTATIDDFELYNPITGGFEGGVPNIPLTTNSFISNLIYAVYGSDDFTFGYKFRGYTIYSYNRDPIGQDLVFSYDTAKAGGANTTTEVTYVNEYLPIADEFEDGYDEDSVKLPPPRGRDVTEYLGSLVIVDHQALYFSDFSVGGTIEDFTPFDTFGVGRTERGLITGVFANETFLTVFREEEAYYITGNIFVANYRIQSYQSTRIGCTDPKSIIDFQGAGLFLSKRGIYFCQQGGAMPEISEPIETLFTDNELGLDLDLSKCTAVVDFRREYIYFHIASTSTASGYVVAFDYYHKEWFLWDGVNGTNGFEMIEESIYYSDGVKVYKEAATSLNSDAYYQSNFETLGEPSFIKKFLQVLLFTVDTTQSHIIGIKTFRDWNKTTVDTNETKQISAGQVDVTQRFNADRSKSLAIQISSTSGNQLIVNGYEYEVEVDVRMFKSDD